MDISRLLNNSSNNTPSASPTGGSPIPPNSGGDFISSDNSEEYNQSLIDLARHLEIKRQHVHNASVNNFHIRRVNRRNIESITLDQIG